MELVITMRAEAQRNEEKEKEFVNAVVKIIKNLGKEDSNWTKEQLKKS